MKRSFVPLLILMLATALACAAPPCETGAICPAALPQVESGVIGWDVGGPMTETVAQIRQQLPPDDSGKWLLQLPVEKGTYRYRLVVDGQWQQDPYNRMTEMNPYGEMNSILHVQ